MEDRDRPWGHGTAFYDSEEYEMHWYELRVAGRGQACRGLFFHDSGEKVFEVSGREGRDMPVFLSSLILTLILLLATFVEEGTLAMRVSSRPLTLMLQGALPGMSGGSRCGLLKGGLVTRDDCFL